MPSQIDFASGDAGSQTTTIGSIFGVDPEVAAAPIVLDHGAPGHLERDTTTPGNWGVPGNLLRRKPRRVGATKPKTATVGAALASFYQLSADEKQAMSNRLEAAGYLGPLGKNKRRNPQDVYSAYRRAVVDAARSGKTITETLDEAQASADAEGVGGGGSGATVSVRLTNPLDLRAGIRDVWKQTLGEAPDEATLDRMIAAYHGQEANVQTTAQLGGTAVDAPSVQSFAQDYAKRADPTRYDARNVVKVGAVLQQMLAGNMPSPGGM